jgi:hypothetical protein
MHKTIVLMMVMVILAATVTFAADPVPRESKTLAPQIITRTVSAVVKQFAKSAPPPKNANKEALPAEITISYPEFSSSTPEKAAVKAINSAIQQRLLTADEGEPPATVDQLAESFFREYEAALKDNPEELGGWSLKFKAVVRYSDEDLLNLEIVRSVFTGGAHSTSDITYLVLSPKTGESINLSAFVPEEKSGELEKIGESLFRRSRRLKPNETLDQAGFQFEANRFALNRNFLVGGGGMTFCFNQYEIAPYSMGITEILIPWGDIKDLLDPKGFGVRFLK